MTDLTQFDIKDDASWYNGVYSDSGLWHWVGRHQNATIGPWSGYRFDLSPLQGVNVNQITSVTIKMKANTAAAAGIDTNIIVEQAPARPWANTINDRPRERSQANNATTNPPVRWTTGAILAAQVIETPNLAERVRAALSTGTWNYATDRLGILMATVGGGGGNVLNQLYTRNNNTVANRPVMVVTTSGVIDPPPPPTPTNVTLTPTAYQNVNSFGVPVITTVVTGSDLLNQSYHDNVGSSVNRTFNLYKPSGTPPAGGWPVVTWVHGGSFTQGVNVPPAAFLSLCRDNGWALACPRYKFTKTDNILFWNNIGWTHTSPVQDYICFLKHLKSNASTYGINADQMVATGESAGGHIALEAALLLGDPNRDTYPMTYKGANPNRSAIFPYLNVSQGRTSLPTVAGAFSFAGPVDLKGVYSTAGTAAASLFKSAILLYVGAKGNDYYPAVQGEGNINEYISSKAGSVYASKTLAAPEFPIGYAVHSDDQVVKPSANFAALQTALGTAGYDTGADTGEVNLGGLSYRMAAYGDATNAHGAVMSTPNLTFFASWMTALIESLS